MSKKLHSLENKAFKYIKHAVLWNFYMEKRKYKNKIITYKTFVKKDLDIKNNKH